MTTVDPLLSETAARVFADHATFAAVEQAEADGWAPAMWAAVAETGLPWVSVSAAAGGSGGTLADAIEIVRLAGFHAVPLPLAETGLLAGWLLEGAGLELPAGAVTVVPGAPADSLVLRDGVLHGRVTRVPWARAVDGIVALLDGRDGPTVVVVDPASTQIGSAVNLAGEPRDTVTFDGVTPRAAARAAAGVDARALRRRGSLARTAAMAGALEHLAALTIEYTTTRRQFGRVLADFQAVQAHLVHGAQHAELVNTALAAATVAAARGPAEMEIAAAKLLADRAAGEASSHAHQAHGAMGMTREYPLHHLTRRLWSWRSEYGDEQSCSRVVGELARNAGADHLYELVADGSRALEPLAAGEARDHT
ncbi:MAG TPA: acyl-CoA dehydrogenase family protein [Acidimicrobiia bacterium]